MSQIKEILGRVEEYRKSGRGSTQELLEDLLTLAQTVQSIRESVHTAEDAGVFCLWVAKLLGTNCRPDSDIDQES